MSSSFPRNELKQQLAESAAADPYCSRFGAEAHEYQLNPPASKEALYRFEAELGVFLPEDYRNFLLLMGDGGAGPFYGLFPLEALPGQVYGPVDDQQPPLLYPGMPSQDPESLGPNWQRGCLAIGSQGCEYRTGLLLTGPHRGRVVYFDVSGSWVFFPREPDFLSWYQRWLREAIAGYDSFFFAYSLDGDQPQLMAHYAAAESEEERLLALYSMNKFPQLSPQSVDFLQTAFWERREMPSAKDFLPLIHRLGREFCQRFLDARWAAGLYEPVVEELSFLDSLEPVPLAQPWPPRLLEALPRLGTHGQLLAVKLLSRCQTVSLAQLEGLWQQTPDTALRLELLPYFARFADADQQLFIWKDALSQREDLPLLRGALLTVPRTADPELRQLVEALQKAYSFSIQSYLDCVAEDPEQAAQALSRNRQQEDVYQRACQLLEELQMAAFPADLPRPYRVTLTRWNARELLLDEAPPEKGIPVHPMVALVLRELYQRLPSTAYDWGKTLGRVKSLELSLRGNTVVHWDEEAHQAELAPPDERPLPPPYYYKMGDWSILGRMTGLKRLTISQIWVEDFSFLTQCPALESLTLNNTSFSDCRLLLQLTRLKRVSLRQCPLQHLDCLENAPFAVQLDQPDPLEGLLPF